ncbi:hypothetical protein CHS0354_019517 [Potamilus streckersoni]|uniref:DZIP3-like HEPN domain-containing protein n=1 Tax=Potamilus streckersoni TaxID=2493646 RepID=A0AAE0SHE3_9BIVA|nr:hypothetical protein CHS0354_019517 [Potamilus streckersoni]
MDNTPAVTIDRRQFHKRNLDYFCLNVHMSLDHYVRENEGSNTLAAYLSVNRNRLTQLPVNVLRQDQRDTLFPPSGKCTLIEDFDITLLCVRFRNLASNMSSNDPVLSGPSITYFISSRCRKDQNYSQRSVRTSSLDNATFKREITNLTTIHKRLITPIPATQFAINDLEQMIDKEKTGPLQPDLENEIRKMRAKIDEWQRYGKV